MRNKKQDYGKVIGLRVDKIVAQMLAEIADRECVSEQAAIRLLIRRSHAARVKK